MKTFSHTKDPINDVYREVVKTVIIDTAALAFICGLLVGSIM